MRTPIRATLVAILALLALSGCAASDSPAPTSSTAPSAAATSPDPSPTPSGPQKSERGNIVKKTGEPFGFAVDGEQVASFVVTAIAVDPTCTSEFAEAPEFGHFIKLDIEGETTSALPSDLFLASGSWFVITEDGTSFNGDPWNMAAAGCLNETERLPSVVGPGERVAGAVLLDAPSAHGVIVLDIGDGVSWEWAY